MDATATTPPAAQADTGKPADDKASEDVIDIIMEGIKDPVKVPVSKIPIDKLQPHLAKLRAEADKKASEADVKWKQAQDRLGSIEKLVARAKEDPAVLEQLAKELGIPEDQLDSMSEARIASRIKKQMQEAEEDKDPGKKAAREQAEEREKLRKENDELKKEQAKQSHAQVRARVENIIVQGMEKLPEKLRSPVAAQEMVSFIRASLEAKTKELGREARLDDLTVTIDDMVKAAREGWRSHASAYWEGDEEAELPESVLKRAEAILAKRAGERPKHPSDPAAGKPGTVNDGKKKPQVNGEAPANRLLGFLRMT